MQEDISMLYFRQEKAHGAAAFAAARCAWGVKGSIGHRPIVPETVVRQAHHKRCITFSSNV